MSDKHQKNPRDISTTDFFLKFMKDEKSVQEKQVRAREKSEERNRRTFGRLSQIINYFNRFLDRMFRNKHSILLLSFVLTVFLYFALSGGNVFETTTSGTTLENVEVKVEGLSSDYEVIGIPETVTIGLIGPSLNIYNAKISNDYAVYADLSDYTEGAHTITLKTRNFDKKLKVMILPETCNIRITQKIEQEFDLEYRFLKESSLDENYSVALDSLSETKVTVLASPATLARIEHVYANIYVADHTSSFKEEVNVKAYDAENREVTCDITPSKVLASVEMANYSKSVAIKANFKGKLKSGYALKNYVLSSPTVTIYGKRSDIADINAVECDVDVSGISKTMTLTGVALSQPKGVNKMSLETIDVALTIIKE